MDPNADYTFTVKGSEVQLIKQFLENQSYASVGELMNKLMAQLNAQLAK